MLLNHPNRKSKKHLELKVAGSQITGCQHFNKLRKKYFVRNFL